MESVEAKVTGTKGTILLVDDSVELVRGLRTLLTNAGYSVVTMASGAMISELVALHRPDLIVLDVMMPGVDGWEALRRIRGNPANDRIAVMMLTAKGTEEAKVQGFTLGADDYLPKPFSVREFRCRVEALLRRSRNAADGVGSDERIAVVSGGGTEFLDLKDVCFIEGIRNYTYVHTYDSRFLSRMSLGEVEEKDYRGLMRVHRSYIVRLGAVRSCRWASRSSFRLSLSDSAGTEIPVSRKLVSEVRRELGLG